MPKLEIQAHEKQRQLIFDETTKYIAAIAGIRGGKTRGGAIKALILCSKYPGIRICVTAATYKMLNDATMPTYEETFSVLPGFATFLHGDNPMCRTANGCEILFRSTDKPNTLRGMELGAVHMDEASGSPYYAFQILQGRLNQRIDGYNRQMWITSTPGGLDWIYSMFILNPSSDYKIISWATRENIFLPEDYVKQIYTDYQGKFKDQELEGKFLTLVGECLFDTTNLNRKLIEECREPQMVDDECVYIWKPPVLGKKYVAGVDCSDEGGGGVNCAVFYDWQTGEEQCEIWGDVASDVFVRLIDKWGRKYNNSLMGIERNGVGNFVIGKMEDLEYPNIWKDAKGKSGYYEEYHGRRTLLEEYKMAVDRNQTIVRSSYAIQEMLTFCLSKEKKWEHISGARDDRIFARAIGWKMIRSPQVVPARIFSVKRKTITYA